MHQLPSDLSSYVNVIVQLALCIATLYAFVALIRATQTEGEPCTFYLLLGAHLLEPLVSVVWGYTIGAFLWILAWMTFPIFGPVFVTLPMLLLLVPLSIDWHNNKLHKWAWWLAMLGLARWIIVMLYIWPAGFIVRELGESSSELEKILAIIVALASLLHAHIALGKMGTYVRSHHAVVPAA